MFDVTPILIIGAGAVAAGLAVLAFLIEGDFARAHALASAPALVSCGGPGLGIVAFSLKLAIISGLTLAGSHGDRPFAIRTIAVPPKTEEPAIVMGAVKWEPLPLTAPEPARQPVHA